MLNGKKLMTDLNLVYALCWGMGIITVLLSVVAYKLLKLENRKEIDRDMQKSIVEVLKGLHEAIGGRTLEIPLSSKRIEMKASQKQAISKAQKARWAKKKSIN